jgi:menaquinone-dependent protoporphyrinogen IX oxidase
MDNLRLNFYVSQVMKKHHRNVQHLVGFGGYLTMDTFLCEQDIRNIARKLIKETYKKHENDYQNVCLWV